MKLLTLSLENFKEGDFLKVEWEDGAREALEVNGFIAEIGERIASYGEQLRLSAQVIGVPAPSGIVGPNGKKLIPS